MKVNTLLLVVLLLSFQVCGQITVETISTDTIDLFSNAREQKNQPSSGAAMALSLLVPGLGHQYTDRSSSALAYLTFDVLSLAGVIFFERYSRQYESSARGFAALYAGADARVKSEKFWQYVAAFNSSEEYNGAARVARVDEDQYYNQENSQWKWTSEDLRKEFNSRRNNSRKLHIASAFCIGAMVIDRVIAFVDVRAATRYRLTQVHTSFSIDPLNSQSSVVISSEF
ncbi:MAG TPA: hypothetical protein VHO70_17230 [Chitinispirillaceae bacterium]|nr:hypothetical protein [Chitinispirillaceae bacterium]